MEPSLKNKRLFINDNKQIACNIKKVKKIKGSKKKKKNRR